jgi:EAL domain-containing protein (putative c-di-GMP-specific phosphodiesterase class I)
VSSFPSPPVAHPIARAHAERLPGKALKSAAPDADEMAMSNFPGESALTRASTYLLQYLHDETKEVWTVTAGPMGRSFVILGTDGAVDGYLSIASAAKFPAALEQIGTAVAAALGILGSVRTTPRSFDSSEESTPLESALVHGRVIAYFQPIVDLSTGNVVALEALARWQTADGVLSPAEFLHSLEGAGLMFELFERMVDESLGFLADYRHRMPDLSVAVNLELGAVPESGLAEIVSELLARHDVRAELLTIELNERLGCDLSPNAARELRKVAAMGVHLVVADFTTTSDIIGRLGDIPIDGAKLDRRHVSHVAVGQEQSEFIRSIIDHADASGLDLIAEGVETKTQCEHLKRLGCKFGQGYYFAVPQSPISLDAVLGAPLASTW